MDDGIQIEGACVRRAPAERGRSRDGQFHLLTGSRLLPPPGDAPLLTLEEAAAYLRMTIGAFRKLLEGRPDGSDGELGDRLRQWIVAMSPRRRYIRREPFLSWLNGLAGRDPGGGK